MEDCSEDRLHHVVGTVFWKKTCQSRRHGAKCGKLTQYQLYSLSLSHSLSHSLKPVEAVEAWCFLEGHCGEADLNPTGVAYIVRIGQGLVNACLYVTQATKGAGISPREGCVEIKFLWMLETEIVLEASGPNMAKRRGKRAWQICGHGTCAKWARFKDGNNPGNKSKKHKTI